MAEKQQEQERRLHANQVNPKSEQVAKRLEKKKSTVHSEEIGYTDAEEIGYTDSEEIRYTNADKLYE